MLKSFNGRAELEVNWRAKHIRAIMTTAHYSGVNVGVLASEWSKRVYGGRKPVYKRGELVGYA